MTSRPWLVSLLVLAAGRCFAADPPALPAGNSYVAEQDAEGYVAKIPLPSSLGKTTPSVDVLEPSLDKKVRGEVLRGSAEGDPLLLAIRIKAPAIRPGTYPFRVRLLTAAQQDDPNPKPHFFDISVQIPAALVAGPPNFELKVTAGCWRECNPPIPVTLRTDKSPWHLTGLKATVDLPFRRDSKPVTGDLLLTAIAAPPDSYRLDVGARNFPYGTTVGQVRVQADQLAQPVTFAVTVVRRLWVGYLLLPIVTGLALGYLLRKYNEGRILVLQREIRAKRLLAQIDRLLQENADERFVIAQRKVRDGIVAGFENGSLQDGQLDAVPAALNEAADRLSADNAALQQAAAEFRKAIGLSYQLPPAMQQAVEQARVKVDHALALDRNNVGQGRQRLAGAEAAFLRELRATAISWQADWKLNRELWVALEHLLTPADRTELGGTWSPMDARAAVIATEIGGPNPNLAGAAKVLDAVHHNLQAWPPFHAKFPAAWSRFERDLLREIGLSNRALEAPWAERAGRIAKIAGSPVHRPAAARDLIEAQAQLRDQLRKWINEIVDPGTRLKAMEAWSENNFLAVVPMLPVVPDKREKLSRFDAPSLGVPATGAETESPLPQSPQELFAAPGRPVTVSIEQIQAELQRREDWRRWFAIAAIAVAAFIVLRATYTGSAMDYLVAFFWAFSTDLAVENAVNLVKPKFPK